MKKHLEFLYLRLIKVHGENENYDYMIKFKEIIDSISLEEDNGWDWAMIFNSPLNELVELKKKRDFLDSIDQSQHDEEWEQAWIDYRERKEQAWYQANQVIELWNKTDHGATPVLKRFVLKQNILIMKAALIISMVEAETKPEVKAMIETWKFLQSKA